MKQTFGRIFKILLVSICIIGSIIFIITSYFSKNIENSVIKKIEQNLESPLILDDVEFSIYNSFPYASIKITNLLVLESKEFNRDTLLFTKTAYVKISLLDIINKIYDLQAIIITDAKINIKYNKLNAPNFLIFRRANKKKAPISIKRITLLNTDLIIKKEAPIVNIDWSLKRSIISIHNQNYTFKIDGFSNKLVVENTNYIKDKNLNLIAKTKIIKDTITISESNMYIEMSCCILKGMSLTEMSLV